jgi:hypothetical protein
MPSLGRIVDPFGLAPRAARFAGDTGLRLLEDVVSSRRMQDAVDVVLASPLIDHVVHQALERRVAQRVLAEAELDALIAEAFESPRFAEVLHTTMDNVLASDELWRVVDEIAASPAVTAAISHQTVGFAGQMADEVGVRSRRADARLEKLARRILHRSQEAVDAAATAVSPAAP